MFRSSVPVSALSTDSALHAAEGDLEKSADKLNGLESVLRF
jgi:hypothetical protein